MITHVHSTPSSAAAHAPARSTLELLEARQLRDALRSLLRREQAAMADFLVALADFDRRRGWEPLGHANLFAFIHSELGLSPAPTFWRQETARLLQRFPDLEAPLRHGTLCLTTMAELAKVLTAENKEAVLPRFLGISSRAAKEIVAELQPRDAPATRTVVTRVAGLALDATAGVSGDVMTAAIRAPPAPPGRADDFLAALPSPAPTGAPPSQLWAPKVDFGGVAAPVARRDEIEPLSIDRSRLHVTVSRRLLKKLEAARDGLSHAVPGATMEQVLEAALDLLLEKQARARGEVKRPRTTPPVAAPRVGATGTAPEAQRHSPPLALALTGPPPPRRAGPREAIPAAVKRAVWARDGGRCSWPIDGGGCCGSTHRLELDHLVPWAMGGEATMANLRLTCARHNRLAARQAFGSRCVERYAAKR
jgi:hypothetical protein